MSLDPYDEEEDYDEELDLLEEQDFELELEPEPGYLALTRGASYSFLISLPLLAMYEILISAVNTGNAVGVRVGADVWTKRILSATGVSTHLTLGTIALAVGIIIFMRDSRRSIPLHKSYFVGMLAESCVYAVFFAIVIYKIVEAIFVPAGTPPDASIAGGSGLLTQLALSLGAGLYEELFFRLILVSGLYALFRLLLGNFKAYLMAAVIGALIFSWVHYIGPFGDPFNLATFTFRFLFGLALNGLFIARGFGIAAWTHAIYDIMVVMIQ
ncbi:MAG: membrane protease YdiL (CAAX protease family) [Rhodothermales bacterium]